MLNKAIKKIQDEIKKNKDDKYIQVIGEYLLEHLKTSPAVAEKILQPDKTIAKSFNELEKVARQRRKGKNYAYIPPQEGFQIVFKYFGISSPVSPAPAATSNPAPVPEAKPASFNVCLEDLLL